MSKVWCLSLPAGVYLQEPVVVHCVRHVHGVGLSGVAAIGVVESDKGSLGAGLLRNHSYHLLSVGLL